MRNIDVRFAALVGAIMLLAITALVLALVVYLAGVLTVVPTASRIPLILIEPSICLDELILLVPAPGDWKLPVPKF